MEFQTLDGVEHGQFVVTTSHGTTHLIDLDAKTVVRTGAPGREWGSELIIGELGGGGSRPKALVTVQQVTPDGEPFHYWARTGPTVGESFLMENMENWRRTTAVVSIESV